MTQALLNPRKLVEWSTFCLELTGPMEFETGGVAGWLGIRLFKLLNLAMQVSVLLSTGYDTVTNFSIPVVSENICYLFPMTTILTKITFTFFNSQSIKQLIERVYRPIDLLKNCSDPGALMIIREAMSLQFFDLAIYIFVCISVSTTTFFLADVEAWETPIRARFPFNSTNSPNYQVVFALQAYAILVNCWWVTSFDTVLLGLIRWLTVDLEILQLNYRQCKFWQKPRSCFKVTEEGVKVIRAYSYFRAIQTESSIDGFIVFEENQVDVTKDSFVSRFVVCLQHQQQLVRNVENVNELFSVVLFVQTFSNCTLTCMGLYGLVVNIKKRQNPMNNIVMLQIGLVNQVYWCTFGHFLIVQHDNLVNSLQDSGWEEEMHNKNFRQVFLHSTVMSMRPIVITAGHFFELSMKSCLNVLNKAYSFFAILNTVTTEKDF